MSDVSKKTAMPDVRFGDEDASRFDWRGHADEQGDEDEELEETPDDVVRMLGFDPKDA